MLPGSMGTYPGGMTFELPSGHIPEITEENLVNDQGRVRALIVTRIEQLWQPIDKQLQMDHDGVRPADPRLLEIGRGLMKDLAVVYRLGRTMTVVEDDEEDQVPVIDRAAMVEERLAEIETRLKAAAG
jgi:hypothetical protein